MAKASPRQKKTTGRVMHEFKHGELRSGPDGKGGKVKNRRQAVAIALSEAGASRYRSDAENRRRLAQTKRKEASGEAAQQGKEGRSHVGASRRRESAAAMGGKNATRTTARGRSVARSRARSGSATKRELYQLARQRKIAGRSRMSKAQLERALGR